jgi:crotonobetainyl-CoA:carnitine CoA-transferase CaiB-like acyl-CoA transferase
VGRLLADLGADVIRVDEAVEPLDALTGSRNANKRSVVLDDPAQLRLLLDHTDVWVESGAGPDAEAVCLELPRLVVVSLSPFGAAGPYCDFAATHGVVYALTGQLGLCLRPGREPLIPPGQLVFEVGGAMAAFLALVAVWNRAVNGVGDHIELSMHEAYIQTIDTALAGASAQDLVANQSGPRAGHPAFPTRDGLVRPLVVSSHQWRALRDWLGDPPELRDEELATYQGRLRHPGVLATAYAGLFAGTETESICDQAQRRNVPVAPVMSPSQLLESEPMRKRGTFADTTIGDRAAQLPAGYWEFDDARIGFRRPARSPGDDTAEVVAALGRGESPFASPPLTVRARATKGDKPLSGLRVLEFTQLMAGPEGGRLLREYGADVIKVESRAFPDQSRVFGGAANISSQFATINRDKRSFGVDLRKPEGLSLALRLVEQADVVIENLGPGVMESIGLGPEAIRQANPRVVVVSSQLFGDHGPWGWWRGFGSHARSIGGQTWLWRYPGSERDFAEDAIFFPDQFVGRLEALAVLACLGADTAHHVRVGQADAVLNSMSELILQESLDPGSVDTVGNSNPEAAPWGIYPCAEGEEWCVINVRDDHDWEALVTAVGRPAWALDPDLGSSAGRLARADELDHYLEDWTSRRAARDVMDTLQQVGVPAGAVLSPSDLLGDPHLHARHFLHILDQPGFDSMLVEGDCHTASHLPTKPPGPAPRQGAHTREIARELLGLADDEVERLVNAGVLEPDPAEADYR